ncbi:hypothetical protein C8R43DRAFT_1236964 [Mycena crocata]|nr:hypothetical protein C8R43DRAFT_1236964 [Mycena crocata]
MDDLSECIAEFELVDPKPSDAWAAYLAQRRAARAAISHVKESLGNADDEENSDDESDTQSAVSDADRPAIYEMVDSAVGDVLACTDLDETEWKIVQDGIFILTEDMQDDGDMNIRTAEVLSRIYSPTTPAAVDVCITYHHRTRYSSVEFYCNIYYRTHNPVAGTELDVHTPEGRRKMHGFRLLLEMGLADAPPGRHRRPINERKFNISASQARTLHRVLFGKPTKKAPGLAAKVSVREMLCLLLASVGVSLHVASAADKDDRDKIESSGELTWEGMEDSARWLGRNIRRVAECPPLSKDAEDSDDGFANDDNEGGYTDEEDEEFGRGWF